MTRKKYKEAQGHMVGILAVAHAHGLHLRRPWNAGKINAGEIIGLHTRQLDKLGVPMWVQNQALEYYNNADDQETWEELLSNGLERIATDILDEWLDTIEEEDAA